VGWRDARVLPGLGIGERIGYGNSPAIVVVDMTRAFTDPSSGVGSDQADTVDATAQVLAAARERGDVPMFFTTMACEADELDAGIWRHKVPALLDVRVDDDANFFDIQAKYGDVVDVPKVLEYPRKGSVEEAAE
jgi:nicotinamidase-related amidase